MSTTDGLTGISMFKGGAGPHQAFGRYAGAGITLAANLTLTDEHTNFLRIDPGGSARDVTLPAEATSEGAAFRILNTADAAENLVVKDDAGATVVTISQNEAAWVVCDGTSWNHMGIESIALS